MYTYTMPRPRRATTGTAPAQTIFKDGRPAFVVIEYDQYRRLCPEGRPRVPADGAVPQEVVELHVLQGLSLRRAWREYLGLTQAEVAARMGISQSALSQTERPAARPRHRTLMKLAKALGVSLRHLR